jgi:hypothetical protein
VDQEVELMDVLQILDATGGTGEQPQGNSPGGESTAGSGPGRTAVVVEQEQVEVVDASGSGSEMVELEVSVGTRI